MTALHRCAFAVAVTLGACCATASLATRTEARATAGTAEAELRRPAVAGRVVVRMRSDGLHPSTAAAGGAAAAALASEGATVVAIDPVLPVRRGVRKPTRTALARTFIVRYSGPASPHVVAATLAGAPDVEWAEPQWEQRLAAIPNDGSWVQQSPALSRMRFPQGWDRTKGEQGTVVVAVVDGGTSWNHADLAANIWSNPGEIAGNSIDDDGNGFVDDVRGWNFTTDSPDPTGLPQLTNNASHGTHVAGIVGAVTNNGAYIAGASWNATLMPVCVSSPTTDNAIAFGYEGILYAAENGADIINCSWGSTGAPSAFEAEVVAYAWEQGAVVVCAAGNGNPTPTSQPHYPGAYPHALSVANVDNNDVRVGSSNYGLTVDVSAQGLNILSTFPGDITGFLTGTSMSSPFVAAACALVKTRWPGYTPDQVAERVRVTSDNIDAANPARAGLLGYGRINVEAALTKNTPAVRIASMDLTDADGDGVIEPGETVDVHLAVTNYLATCTGLEFRLRETSPHASVVDSVATLAGLDSLQTTGLVTLRLAIAPTAPIAHVVGCILAVTSSSPAYTDKDRFTLDVLPPFVTHDINQVHATITSVGKLGFATAPGGTTSGVGFRYAGGPNLLYEGALMMGTSAMQVSDAARTTGPNPDDDFVTSADGVPRVQQPGQWAPQQTRAAFTDAVAGSPLPVAVRQETYAYVDALHDDYIIQRLAIRNTGIVPVVGLRVGWYLDWDVDGGTFDTNRTGFDVTRDLGWVRDTGAGPPTWAGVQVLNAAGATSYRGIWNDPEMSIDWGVYDGFTEAEKWDCLSGGVVHAEVGPADVSNAIATGPFTLAPGDSVEVGFAFLGGNGLASLQQAADAAALKWQHLHSGTPVTIEDLTAAAGENSVRLRWRTTREVDVAGFRILRSIDDGPRVTLEPDIAPRASRTYEFQDNQPVAGDIVYHVAEIEPTGGVRLLAAVGIRVETNRAPARTFLAGAVPNPFNPATTIRFGLRVAGPATLDVFDARGRRIRRLWSDPAAAPGEYAARWDGRDDAGRRVASGVYLVQLQALGSRLARRVTLVQ